MSFWGAVVLIFLIGSMTWLRAQKYRAKPGQVEDRTFLSGDAELEREVQELRKRIAVLERIATEDKKETDLARQIEALRD